MRSRSRVRLSARLYCTAIHGLCGWIEALTCVVEVQLQERYEVFSEMESIDVVTKYTILVPVHDPFKLIEIFL
jgi:hypothetical protein